MRTGQQVAPVTAAPPSVPAAFWQDAEIRAALAERHMGRVIRAFRRHPWHGRTLAQESVAEWLGTTQPRLSRIENGARTEHLDLLAHWAVVLGVPQRLLWFALPGHAGALPDGLAVASQERSRALAAEIAGACRTPYLADDVALETIRRFVGSPKRVCLIVGPPGVGKTTLGLRLVGHVGDVADVQVHPPAAWSADAGALAAEILRYGSVPGGADPAGEVERECWSLERPLLVVVDGVTSQRTWERVAGAVDQLLRQVLTDHLRFVVLARTPPELDVTTAPLVAASLFCGGPEPGPALRMAEWTPAQAEQVWDGREDATAGFGTLPGVVQHLARSPLSMRMMVDAGSRTSASTFDLIGSFVRGALRGLPDEAWTTVRGAASAHLADVVDVLADIGLPAPATDALPALHDPSDRSAFLHDVVAEHVLATGVVDVLVVRDSTALAARTLNRLARAAASSASAVGVLGFVVDDLDGRAVDLLRSALTTPAADQQVMVPAVLRHAAEGELRALSPGAVAECARRCSHLESARALLALRLLPEALRGEFGSWTIATVRRFGSDLWDVAAGAVDRSGDPAVADAVVAAADLDHPSDALFLARHLSLFVAVDLRNPTVAGVVEHQDWRVRGALAEGLDDLESAGAGDVVAVLVGDPDYKVRAAVAGVVARCARPVRDAVLAALLRDEVWHVRVCALLGVAARAPDDGATEAVRRAVDRQASWRAPPVHAASALARVALHLGLPELVEDLPGAAVDRALFPLLRAHRSGVHVLSAEVLGRAREIGGRSPSWVVRREAGAGEPLERGTEWFRRMRGRRCLQVALDLQDVEHAVRVAAAAAAAGAHLLEVGDPLIKQAGLAAISAVKQAVPDVPVIAEMMSADWGRDQVELAARAGADAVLLIGLASATSVASAVAAGRRLGVPVLLDTRPGAADQGWIREVERLGVDGLVVTTNIDLGVAWGQYALEKCAQVRSWTSLPVAVSGGFSLSDTHALNSGEWDLMIVGRSIIESTDPARATRTLLDAVTAPITREARTARGAYPAP